MRGNDGKSVSIIVLAAGLSTRFGRNKLLESIGSTTMIGHVVSETLRSKADRTIVVLGHDSEKVMLVLEGYRCDFVINEEYEKGQSFSVRKGLSSLSASADAVMILPGDVAGVDHRMIDAVIDEYARSNAPIVTAGYNGRSGHPILFDMSLIAELKDIDEESWGIKKVVSRHRSQRRLVETSTAALLDVDTQDDLKMLADLPPSPTPGSKPT
jgi:molybdenum cofactor cytidylyltransferase